MGHDIVIRNGNVVDGTGSEPYQADIAVDGDRIAEIGKVDGKGREEINADGLNVSPGFIDLHTHLDAQVGWDPLLTSISWHGVTTALMGNCGVTFAPCKPSDKEYLAAMMETVEDIPKQAILEGLPWDWESYGDYLDSLEALHPSINLTGMVGHCAIRFYVMGERAVEELATEDEVRQIADLVGQSVKEGAVGFSTNRHPQHVLPDGRSIPGTFAHRDEVRAVAKAVGQNGIIQTVSNHNPFDEEMDLIADEARITRGALFAIAVGDGFERLDERVMAMRNEGSNVIALTVPRGGGEHIGLSTPALIHGSYKYVNRKNLDDARNLPAWLELYKLDPVARLAKIRDHEFRQKLIDQAKAVGEDGIDPAKSDFWMGDAARPDYTTRQSLHDLAEAAGEHPIETWLRIADESNGRALFHTRRWNLDLDRFAEGIAKEWVMPVLGDVGAHVTMLSDSGWPSFLLSHWHRDTGVYSLQEAVRRITGMPAGLLGIDDRGTLAVGKRADINVFDIARVEERMPEIVHDFPFGAPRFIQRAAGYKTTLVNGRVTLRDDELTGERAGQVLRSN